MLFLPAQLLFQSFLLFQQCSVLGLPFLLSGLPISGGISLLPAIDNAHSRPRRNDSSQPIPVGTESRSQFLRLSLEFPSEVFFQDGIHLLCLGSRRFLQFLKFLSRFGQSLLEGRVEYCLISGNSLELFIFILQLLLELGTLGLPLFRGGLGSEVYCR